MGFGDWLSSGLGLSEATAANGGTFWDNLGDSSWMHDSAATVNGGTIGNYDRGVFGEGLGSILGQSKGNAGLASTYGSYGDKGVYPAASYYGAKSPSLDNNSFMAGVLTPGNVMKGLAIGLQYDSESKARKESARQFNTKMDLAQRQIEDAKKKEKDMTSPIYKGLQYA
jgi:hypothetical protein